MCLAFGSLMANLEYVTANALVHKLHLVSLLVVYCVAQSLSITSPEVIYQGRRLSALVPSTPLLLQYHKGPLLTGNASINVYILWYGTFSPSQKAIISDFVSSLGAKTPTQPSVSSWWATTERYIDAAKQGVSRLVKIGGQASDALYSLGKSLKRSHIALLVKRALSKRLFPSDARGIYIVLTADDVYVERFCMDSCGFHDSIPLSKSERILFGWVGNSGIQCPGQCAWPFAAALYGPPAPPLIPPNGDVGVDGMIINIATIITGTATNPFNTGYYQGSAVLPLEAVTACSGIFGKGAYPGYPGELLMDKKSRASYNAYGINNREFLVPGMWEPSELACKTTLS